MKKILFVLLTLFFVSSAIIADERIENMQTMLMPTDAQIREAINDFNIPEDQREQVFEETRNQLEQFYSSSQILLPILQGKNQNINSNIQIESIQKDKKYTSHPPLTRRKKQNY